MIEQAQNKTLQIPLERDVLEEQFETKQKLFCSFVVRRWSVRSIKIKFQASPIVCMNIFVFDHDIQKLRARMKSQ